MGGQLFYGDNLDILRDDIPTESVDLIYLDPPFNSNASYNVLFKSLAGEQSHAQIEAFEDTWHWTPHTQDAFDQVMKSGNADVAEMLRAMRLFLKENDMMAYLTMMSLRLLELHRVLKPTGSLFLHCDPTASHYLKILLDATFGRPNFRNEIIWSYKRWTASKNQLPKLHDVIFGYSKSDEFTFHAPMVPNSTPNASQYVSAKDQHGKTVVARDESGKPIKRQLASEIAVGDVWEIPILSPVSKERPVQSEPAFRLRCILRIGLEVLFVNCGIAKVANAQKIPIQLERR
jgi:site-specific DNA-methyltransferase (adenine-specific)